MLPFRLLLASLALLGTVAAYAADGPDPISAERPGFTNGTDTVPQGKIQWEGGYQFAKDSSSKQHILGDGMQVRYPFAPNAEVRLGLPDYSWQRDDSGMKTNGFGDASVSLKYRFLEAKDSARALPALAVIGNLELPTANRDFREDDYQPSLALEADWSLTDKYSLTADTVYNGVRQGGSRYDEWSGGLCLTVTLSPVWGTFAEVYRVSDTGAGDTHANFADTGLTCRIGANTVVDVNGGVGITGAKDSYFMGGGIARRW